MSYDKDLADRVRRSLGSRRGVSEQGLFGGVAFKLFGNLCVGVQEDALVARIGETEIRDVLGSAHVRVFEHGGAPLGGWVMVARPALESSDSLSGWVRRAAAYVETLPHR